jgi:hypothetical protein
MEVTASLNLNIVVTIEAESLEQAYQKFYSLYPKIEFENRGSSVIVMQIINLK